jgi:hypothetical protein
MNIYLKYLFNTALFFISTAVYFGMTDVLIDLIDFEDYDPVRFALYIIRIYLYIPIVPFLLQFSFKESRLFYIKQLRKNYLKVLTLILTFIFLTAIINFLFAIDAADGYQEEEVLVFFNLSLLILYIGVFTFIHLKYLKSNVITLNFRSLFFKSLFYISLVIALFSLKNITSCADNPGFLILLSLLSLFICTLISLIDLIISLFKNYFSYMILIYPLLLGASIYGLLLLVEIYGNDGKCNLIFGPDDSGMALTFILIALYSFITKNTDLSISSSKHNKT